MDDPADPSAAPPPLLAHWRERAASFHEELVEKRGDGWQAFWGSRDSQRARYQVLLEQLPLHDATVLEVGCGFGDFLDYAAEHGVRPARYLGVDLSARIVAGAQQRHPEGEFAVLDVLHSDPPLRPDFVLASGIMAVAVEGYAEYVLRTLRRFHALAGRGFGLNFLSTCSTRPDGVSQYVEPAWLLGLFQRQIDWRCRLIHDYRPNDFTLIHRRP
jgi:SAM-dependent methyltransferase